MHSTTLAIIVIVAVIAVLVFVYLLRAGSDSGADVAAGGPHTGTHTGAAAAIEDVAGEFVGVDANRDVPLPEAGGPADPLTLIKGLGPKASQRMAELGITRFDQLAALDGRQQAALDLKMGAFQGRLVRDRWVEQAEHLARGDNAGFEAKFGKLGG